MSQVNFDAGVAAQEVCVVCYDACGLKTPCCDQPLCEGCAEEIAKRHDKPTCPNCREPFKIPELCDFNNKKVNVLVSKSNEELWMHKGILQLKPKTVKLTQEDGKVKLIKYEKIRGIGIQDQASAFMAGPISTEWVNWNRLPKKLRHITDTPKSIESAGYITMRKENKDVLLDREHNVLLDRELFIESIEILNDMWTPAFVLFTVSSSA